MALEGTFTTRDYKQFQVVDGKGETIWEGEEHNRMLPGDIVRYTSPVEGNDISLELIKREPMKNIVGILQTSSQIRQGIDKRGHIIYIFRPINMSLPEFAVASNLNRQLTNQWCVVDYLDWPANSKRPRGSIQQYLGLVGDYKVELEALYKHYRSKTIEHKSFMNIYKDELEGILRLYGQSSIWQQDRQVLDDYIVSIDPVGCRDIDDALSFVELGANRFSLSIHIADVGFWIKENSSLDNIAKELGSTLYGVDKNFPIYPRELSEGVLSLLPDGSKRASISLQIVIDGKQIVQHQLTRTVIRNSRALDYDNYREEQNIDWDSLFRVADLLANEIGLPKINGDSHKLVEILMIYYNHYIANLADCHLFRAQSSHLAEQEANLPEELRFMALESAVYTSRDDNGGHYCLGLEKYTHATSPIRRYADLLVQRGLLVSDTMLNQLNSTQKISKKFHRDVQFIKAIYENEDREVGGIVMDSNYVYILEWRQRVRFGNGLEQYSRINLRYYIDPNPIQWKKKIIFQQL